MQTASLMGAGRNGNEKKIKNHRHGYGDYLPGTKHLDKQTL
jgi:hypothetical protein